MSLKDINLQPERYWDRQQRLADDYAAAEGAREHDAWQVKVKGYFEWRESLPYDEDDGYIRFADEDRERQTEYGITAEDCEQWENQKWQATQDLPF